MIWKLKENYEKLIKSYKSNDIATYKEVEKEINNTKGEIEKKVKFRDFKSINKWCKELAELELDLWQMKSQQLQQQEQKKLLQEIPNKEYQAHIENNK